MRRFSTRFARLLLLITPALSAQTPVEQIRAQHQQILDRLNRSGKAGHPLELDDDAVRPLLNSGWKLAGAWAAAWLEAHPKASKGQLEGIFDGFAPKPPTTYRANPPYTVTGSAVRLGPDVFVVEATYVCDTATSSFLVIARDRNGHLRSFWNIKDLAEQHYLLEDEIGRWAYLVSRHYYNGPLGVEQILPLPTAANGHSRFLVDAFQAADGGTILAQLSIWEWDGAEAKPLLIDVYEYAVGYTGFRFDGSILRIRTKESTESFFSCGMCDMPRGLWTIQIRPAGVKDLGRRFQQPEVQWADELVSKVKKGADTSEIAGGSVSAALRKGADWGMLASCRVLRRGQRGAFELRFDECLVRFHYELRGGRPYFTAVQFPASTR